MDKDKNIQKELENISPFLAKLKKEEGFGLPEDYFAQLEESVLEQCQTEAPLETVPVSVQEKPQNWLATSIANFFETLFQPRLALALASVVLLVALGIFFVNKPGNQAYADLSTEDALSYIIDNIDDFEEVDLLENIRNEDLSLVEAFDFTEDESLFYLEQSIDDLDENLLEDYL